MKNFLKYYKQKNKAFALLYAILISSILLSISIGVANIAYKELQFGTQADQSDNAFYAADIGAECALYYDKSSGSAFGGTLQPPYSCAGNTIAINGASPVWTFNIPALNTDGKGCAIVSVNKSVSGTKIISKGYNNGSGGAQPNWTCTPTSNTLERQLEVNY
jgi:hypothetical protein